MVSSRFYLLLLPVAFCLFPLSGLQAQSLNSGNTPLPQELLDHVDAPDYESRKQQWIQNNPSDYQKLEDEAAASFVAPESGPSGIPSDRDNSDLPWYNYKGESDISAAKKRYYQEKPEAYQQFLQSSQAEK